MRLWGRGSNRLREGSVSLRGRSPWRRPPGQVCTSPEAISHTVGDCFVVKERLLATTLLSFYIPKLIQHILIIAPIF